jgi:hypothetical protein
MWYDFNEMVRRVFMLDKIKKQNIFVIALEFAMIVLVIVGITYAIYYYGNNFNLKTGDLGIDTDIYGDTVIDSDNIVLTPIVDSTIDNNDTNVLKIDFNVRGSKENVVSNIIYDIALVDLEIDCELISKYLKWDLLKNGEELESGSFSYDFDDIVDGRLVLTSIQQDLVDYSSNPDQYQFRLWLSDSCQSDNISECVNSEDQSNLLNKSISGKLEVELYTGSKSRLVRNPSDSINYNSCIQNLDTSGANRPVMDDGMIAVSYDEDNNIWVKADKNNSDSNNLWYNYNNKKWANAVLVKDYDKYKDSNLGSEINDDDIVAFYVWIPRYKYQVWNINGDEEYYNDYLDGVSIEFENGLSDSGSITCGSDKCVGNNGEWVTHPAFTTKNIKGFWMAKYETKGSYESPVIKDSGETLVNYSKEKALSTSLKFLDYNINKLNLELVTNLEWGAVSYLSYSKYGSYLGNSDISVNSVYGINDNVFEMVIFDSDILGSASFEVGSTLDSYDSIIYRNKLFNIASTSSNYEFRNVLY